MGSFSEAVIESYLHSTAQAQGWASYKWVSPGKVGVPDRIMIDPFGIVRFVEVKQLNGRLSPAQLVECRKLVAQGAEVYIVRSKKDADAFLDGTLTQFAG